MHAASAAISWYNQNNDFGNGAGNMLDKTVPYFDILMEKPDISQYPRYTLPEGFRFSGYRPEYAKKWAELLYTLEQTDTLEEARALFRRDFLSRPKLLEKQCIFVLNEAGKVAATASLWPGSHFGSEHLRIHWVSAAPEYQGKGLVKALLTHLLDIYQELDHDGILYLSSSTWNYKAVNIYKQFGFVPYTGKVPANWKGGRDYQKEFQAAWPIIDQKLEEYRQRSSSAR